MLEQSAGRDDRLNSCAIGRQAVVRVVIYSVLAGVLVRGLSSSVDAQPRRTFTRDIAPIVWARCAACHRAGDIGPFPLITYADVKRHLTQIAAVTARRVMPPWKPTPGKGDFQDERRLSDRE